MFTSLWHTSVHVFLGSCLTRGHMLIYFALILMSKVDVVKKRITSICEFLIESDSSFFEKNYGLFVPFILAYLPYI